MVKESQVENTELSYDDEVEIPWGPRSRVRAKVREVYGQTGHRQVVVLLTPEVSGYVVAEPTTLSLSIDKVRKIASTV